MQSTLTPLLGTALPPRQAARSPLTPLQGKALPRQVTTSLQVRQAVKAQLSQAGKLPGAQSGIGPPGLPGEQCCLPGRQDWFLEGNPTPTPQQASPRVFLRRSQPKVGHQPIQQTFDSSTKVCSCQRTQLCGIPQATS